MNESRKNVRRSFESGYDAPVDVQKRHSGTLHQTSSQEAAV